jgi:hypothetical protein
MSHDVKYIPPDLKHSRMISKGASRRILGSYSHTFRRYAHFLLSTTASLQTLSNCFRLADCPGR